MTAKKTIHNFFSGWSRVIVAILPMLLLFLVNEGLMRSVGLYAIFPNMDIVMHVLGGFVTAWALWNISQILRKRKHYPSFRSFCFVIVGLTFVVGIGWELYELLHDFLFPGGFIYQAGIQDALGDLIMDGIGAWLFCCLSKVFP